ncbi:CMP-N-acetylneuraminate-beta-galactosamide-alpha-2,3-sialyltransferase 4-like [Glandiceps talaboti]
MLTTKKFFLTVAILIIPTILCALLYNTGGTAYSKYIHIIGVHSNRIYNLDSNVSAKNVLSTNSTFVRQMNNENHTVHMSAVNISSQPSPSPPPSSSRTTLATVPPPQQCIKGHVQKEIQKIIPSFDLKTPIFLTPSYKTWNSFEDMMKLGFPYGVKNDVSTIDNIMNLLTEAGKPDRFGEPSSVCRRCILVANGGVSLGKRLGKVIDSYDIVIRMNTGPVARYEKDVGQKTSFRLIYPESALNTYDPASDIVFLAYTSNDVKWLEAILQKKDPRKLNLSFWKGVPSSISKNASQVRFLNPAIHEVTRSHLETKSRPSCGAVALELALNYCDHVDITGFGYDTNLPIHYYQSKTGVVANGIHSWSTEKKYILRLLYCGVIGRDLSGLYAKEARLQGHSFRCDSS